PRPAFKDARNAIVDFNKIKDIYESRLQLEQAAQTNVPEPSSTLTIMVSVPNGNGMCPSAGVGLSVGLNDFELMKRSLKSFLITTLFSVTTATIFFLVS
ncbi:hypothetical protein PZH42_29995, partial [Bacteroides cellulosilyticus]|nr:hypothetical protein [Bacteroides cellulosilyticus]